MEIDFTVTIVDGVTTLATQLGTVIGAVIALGVGLYAVWAWWRLIRDMSG